MLADQGGARLYTIGKSATRTARRHPIVLGKDDIRSCRQMLDSEIRLQCTGMTGMTQASGVAA